MTGICFSFSSEHDWDGGKVLLQRKYLEIP